MKGHRLSFSRQSPPKHPIPEWFRRISWSQRARYAPRFPVARNRKIGTAIGILMARVLTSRGNWSMDSNYTFMKTFAFALALAGVVSITACNKNGGDAAAGNGGNAQIATVPSPTINGCFQNATTSSWWQRYNVQAYPSSGYGQQGYQTNYAQGFCGCPAGTMPTCSGQGMLCMPVQHLNMNVATWSYGQNQFNPQYRCANPYRDYAGYRRRGGGRGIFFGYNNADLSPNDDRHTPDDRRPDDGRHSDDDRRPDDDRYPQPDQHQNAGHYPQQPIPQNPQTQQYPSGGGLCSNSVAQTCTPNVAIPMTPGQMYCQPLQAGNFSGPGIWVRL
jgi:hypothetical protein